VLSYQVNQVLDLVPTAVSLLERLREQADKIRRLGNDLAVNISNLRSQIDVARDQANLVSINLCLLYLYLFTLLLSLTAALVHKKKKKISRW